MGTTLMVMESSKTRRRSLIGTFAERAIRLIESRIGEKRVSSAEPPSSDTERYRHLRITRITNETPNAKSFYVEELDRSELSFRAGQYLTVEVYLDGRVHRRAYSLMSPALPGAARAFTVERVPGGKVSNHLLDFYEEGMLIRARGPSGDFTVERAEERLGNAAVEEIRFFAYGNGVTPIVSLVETLLETSTHLLSLYHHVPHGEPRLFGNRIEALLKAHPDRFRDQRIESADADSIHHLIDTLWSLESSAKPLVYICGPRSFRERVSLALEEVGVRRSRVFEERFDSPPMLNLVELPEEPQRITIRFGETVRHVEVPRGKTILDAGLDGGAPLPHRCMIGDCGSCAVRVQSGEAWSRSDGPLSQRERERGMILACMSHPLSKMEIEIP